MKLVDKLTTGVEVLFTKENLSPSHRCLLSCLQGWLIATDIKFLSRFSSGRLNICIYQNNVMVTQPRNWYKSLYKGRSICAEYVKGVTIPSWTVHHLSGPHIVKDVNQPSANWNVIAVSR